MITGLRENKNPQNIVDICHNVMTWLIIIIITWTLIKQLKIIDKDAVHCTVVQ